MAAFEIKMPKLGESITEGTIISWSVKVGETIREDDILFEVNTAKVSAEIPSPVSGKVLEILFQEGDTVSVGTVVALVDMEGEDSESNKPQDATSEKVEPPITEKTEHTVAEKIEPVAPAVGKLAKSDEDRWYSPVVLEKAREAKIGTDELNAISGTGYLGRVSKRDIERYIAGGQEALHKPIGTLAGADKLRPVQHEPAKPSAEIIAKPGDEVIPMDFVRRIISDRMTESKRISPHVTNVIEVDVTKLVNWREQHKDEFRKKEGISLTYMPMITQAAVMALKDFPRVNSSVDGYNIIQKKEINIGVAVSLDDGNLIVPVIKNADRMSLSGLAGSISTLAAKARSNRLSTDDIEGGTFTITNFGSFKSLFGTPIINQPEVAILGVGVIEKRPAVIETPDGDAIAIRHKMYLSLAYDHRIIDGALGGNFLYGIARYLENWNG